MGCQWHYWGAITYHDGVQMALWDADGITDVPYHDGVPMALWDADGIIGMLMALWDANGIIGVPYHTMTGCRWHYGMPMALLGCHNIP